MEDIDVYSAMQTGKPLASFKKVILANVYITYLNPFPPGEPVSKIIHGNPNKESEKCIIDVWTPQQLAFFKVANDYHLKKGNIIPWERNKKSEPSEEEIYNSLPDSKLDEILNDRWFTFKAALNKMTAEAVLVRFLKKAEDQEKSVKYIDAIKAKLSEVQSLD